MNFWWVNQKQTFKHEFEGGYMWSPKTDSNGRKNVTYDNMTKIAPGDLIFSYSYGEIKAVAFVTNSAESQERPSEFGKMGSYWKNDGWIVQATYHMLRSPKRSNTSLSNSGETSISPESLKLI